VIAASTINPMTARMTGNPPAPRRSAGLSLAGRRSAWTRKNNIARPRRQLKTSSAAIFRLP